MQRSDLSKPTPADDGDFLTLIRSARSGCDEAMEELIRRCQPYLLAIANAEMDDVLAPKVGASDIVQNSMISAQRCIADFRGQTRDELLAWLRGILIRDLKETHRHYRAGKRHVGRERPLRDESVVNDADRLMDVGESPSTAAAEREQEEQLYRALATLGEDERQVIELRNWQRLPFAEIGPKMKRSPDAARKLWSRAIIRLQKILDGGDD